MGICCCRSESPCDNPEERNGLLKDDSKGTVPCDDRGVVGNCGPDRADDLRAPADEAPVKAEEKAAAVQLKKSPANGETKANNAQENGPPPREVVPATIHSPGKKQENTTGVQDKDMEETLVGGDQADLLQCTFDSLHTGISSALWEVPPETSAVTAEAVAASVEDTIPVVPTPPAEAANLPHTETNTTTPDTNHPDNGDDSKVTIGHAATDPLEEISPNNEMVSALNTQPTAAEGQVLSITVAGQEIDSEPLVVTADPECSPAREDSEPEDIQGHTASDLSGSESPGLDHSGEERDSANTVSEPATTGRAAASESPQPTEDDEAEPAASPNATASSEKVEQDVGEESSPEAQNKGDVPKVKETEEEEGEARAPAEAEEDAEIEEASEEEQQVAGSTLTYCADSERKDTSDAGFTHSEDDLYRGAEELSASQGDSLGPPATLEPELPKVEDRCSLAPPVDILQYSEREWKGNTAKSVLIRKGYKEMSQRFGSVRRVRGDNYCALRATLFQVLSHTTQLPAWLQDEDISLLPEELETQEGLISQWTFPGQWTPLGDGGRDVTQQLKACMELLRNKWRAAVGCASAAERQQLCHSVFQGGDEELGLLEALKLLMLGRAAELHASMQANGDVPLFCWLLFARDSSDCPRSFLANHLSHVGLSAGLEQVEMFLLGYALQCTIQVYRLYKADTEEFVTYYPDDHKDDWPSVCLVTEDDRHYNVPVEVDAAELPGELASS